MNSQCESHPNGRSVKWRRLRLLAGWGVCMLPLFALANAPRSGPAHAYAAQQTQPVPDQQPPTLPPLPDSNDNTQPPPRHQHLGMNNGNPSPEDLKADEQWMQANAPNRWQYYQSLVATHQPGANHMFREYILPRIHQIKWMEKNDPKLYDLSMQRVKLEDDAFGLLQKLNAATDPATRTTLTDQLKQKLADMYDNTLTERQQRLDELTKMVQAAQKELVADEQPDHKAKHVEETLDRALQTGTLENPHEPGPRMRGPGMMPPPSTQPAPSDSR